MTAERASVIPIAPERSVATVDDCRDALRAIYGILADLARDVRTCAELCADMSARLRQLEARASHE